MSNITHPSIVTLYDRLVNYTGEYNATKINDDAAIGQWLLEGCFAVVNHFRASPEIERFIKSDDSDSAGSAITNFDEIHDLIRVEREGYPCRYVAIELKKHITLSTSLYFPSDEDPVFQIDNGVLNVYPPLPGGTDEVIWYYIPNYTILNWETGGTSTIADFPSKYYDVICVFAAMRVVERRLADLTGDLPDNVITLNMPVLPIPPVMPSFTDATVEFPVAPVFNAPGLAVNLGSDGVGPLFYLQTEEDTDLVSSALSIVEKELSLFDKRMDLAKQEYEAAVKEFDMKKEQFNKRTDVLDAQQDKKLSRYNAEQQDYDKAITIFNSELTKYREGLAGEAKKFDNEMSKIKSETETLQTQLGILKMNYNEKLGIQAQAAQ